MTNLKMAEETRDRIVHAAYRVLAAQGYDATSVKDIAGRAEVAREVIAQRENRSPDEVPAIAAAV